MNSRLLRVSLLGHLSLIICVSSCGSSSDPNVGPSAGAGNSLAGSHGIAGNSGVSGGGVGGSVAGASSAGGGGISGIGGGGGGSAGVGGSGGQVFSGPCTPPNDIDKPFEKLSQTGCMSTTEKTKFAALVIPYEVNSPLWSDSADKQRGMVIPVGQTVHIKDCTVDTQSCTQGTADTGKWVFPVGTVMLKNFAFDGKLVETRLFVRHDADTWVGYSYQWDEAQSEATIVSDDRKDVMFNTGARTVPWQYPSRIDCMKCHNAMGGSTIGPETRQMNRIVGAANQIDHLNDLKIFDKAPAKPYAAAYVTPYAGQAGMPPADATLETRARSYLAANCAFCHRPDGDFFAIDMRFDKDFKDMKLCNVEPMQGNQGVIGAVNLKPGDTANSIMYLRMKAKTTDTGRMPQIGTNKIDDLGLKLIGDWITSIKTCPQ